MFFSQTDRLLPMLYMRMFATPLSAGCTLYLHLHQKGNLMLNQSRFVLMCLVLMIISVSAYVHDTKQPVVIYFGDNDDSSKRHMHSSTSYPMSSNAQVRTAFSDTPWWVYFLYAVGGYVVGSVWLEAEAEAIKSGDWATWITVDVYHQLLERETDHVICQLLDKEPYGMIKALQELERELARVARFASVLFYLNLFPVRKLFPRYNYMYALVEHYEPRLQLLQETIQSAIHTYERELMLRSKSS